MERFLKEQKLARSDFRGAL